MCWQKIADNQNSVFKLSEGFLKIQPHPLVLSSLYQISKLQTKFVTTFVRAEIIFDSSAPFCIFEKDGSGKYGSSWFTDSPQQAITIAAICAMVREVEG